MKNPDQKTMEALAHVSQHVPRVLPWLEAWYTQELERLPVALNNVAVAQGRCQVLGEIVSLLRKSPEYAASPQRGAASNTHTDRSV